MGESVGAGDLAELLRELKERSGLSYGALAKRLHVSTSTLHRYVNGSAVPTEFAPLERLARVCGATREEMVEVHRRWILADATRGDRREGDSAPKGLAPEEPAPEEPAPKEPESGAPTPTSDTPTSGTPTPSDPATDPDDGTPGIVISRTPAPAPALAAGRRLRERLPRARVLVAAGVVAALGATAVAVQAASGGGDRDRVSTSSPTAEGGESDRNPGVRSASPSGKADGKGEKGEKGEGEKDSGTAKGKGGAKGDGERRRTPVTGESGTGSSGAALSGAPVTVSTQAQYWDQPCGHPYLVDKAPGTLSPPPNEQDAAGWVSANGAVSARDQSVKLTVQGTGKDTVVLEALHVRVAGTDAPLSWNNFKMGYLGVGCGSGIPRHTFAVNLDASVPRPSPDDPKDTFPYKVSASDPEAFYVNATANTRYVRWYLELEWSSGDRHGTVRIDDSGKPFATSGDKSRPVYAYSLNSKKWTPTHRNDDDVPDPPA
ncbi:helix-turn-helix transcriptional regulator [Streptomyces sp. NPDC005562]|uniref:helix-turn-helix domain-containing protein n=1 Tax=Streptomyces sp. NPDC005562 TaxID=3154890 RepID=UPI0033AFE313